MHKKRLCLLYFLFLSAMLLMSARLYTISTHGSFAQTVLSGQYSRKIDIAKRCGFIFDRNGDLTDLENDLYAVFIDPSEMPQKNYEECSEMLSKISQNEASYYFEKMFSSVPFVTVTKKPCEGEGIRCYKLYSVPDTDFLCHITGYSNSDGVGVSGIRKVYDEFLQNEKKDVFARYTANAKGAELGDFKTEIYDDGYCEENGIYLTIDSEMQKTVEKICETELEMGAVVVQNIRSGEILASVSKPTYNISDVVPFLTSDKGEFLNRAFLGYTPGSVFKTVVAAAFLEKDISLVDREYECTGYTEVQGNKISCHKKDGHGKIKMREAFSQSCNPYFISLVLEYGVEEVIDMAKKMGVSKSSYIDKVPVSKGVLPEGEISLTDAANTAVGQGKILLSPIEMNTVMMCAATGYFKEPVLVQKLVSEGEEQYSETEKKERILSPNTVAALRSMLESCVNNGTGYRVKNENVPCGGKTATAQSGQIKDGKEVIHSWFSGYFPADEPKYAVTVLCDGNGERNLHPSLIFKEVAESLAK